MSPVISGPRCNIKVTCDPSPSNDRSESSLAVNPNDPFNLAGSSKRFTDPAHYGFSLAAYSTFDGGRSWNESAPLGLPVDPVTGTTAAGTSDPAVAFDTSGNAYLVGLPFSAGSGSPDDTGSMFGICIYKSADGGRTWSVPVLIHRSTGDDKQSIVADHSSSTHRGNVYVAWDDGDKLAFARLLSGTTNWIGPGAQPAGTPVVASGSFATSMAVDGNGVLHIVWYDIGAVSIKHVMSSDGGGTFSTPDVVAQGITPLPGQFTPMGIFRVFTLPTIAVAPGNRLVVAWADYRESGGARIYYRSSNSSYNWQGPNSGQAMLSGVQATPAGQHDFHPQLANTPAGDVGCAFYEFGPKTPGGAPLIDVFLAVSTGNNVAFNARTRVTDTAWDPTVAPVYAHGSTSVTFIGDYFGHCASQRGFHPFWTDTRTGVQEIFTSRLALNPTDVYIRDSSSDTGDVPSPGDHWEAPDLVVRWQQDGTTNFVDQPLKADGVTEHYVYGRVTNRGGTTAHNVALAVTVGNYPALDALPGLEFRYPQDWYEGDWFTSAVQARHTWLGTSTPVDVPAGTTQIIGPVPWPAALIPPHATWHPCLLAEVRCDNDDSDGWTNGCPIPADPDPCAYGSYFWGSNNICQRNLSYLPMSLAEQFHLPVLVGSEWRAGEEHLEVIIERTGSLIGTRAIARVEALGKVRQPLPRSAERAVEFLDSARVRLHAGDTVVGHLHAAPGTVWHPDHAALSRIEVFGGEREGDAFRLDEPRAALRLPVRRGEMHRLVVTLQPGGEGIRASHGLVRIFQRNARQQITGAVFYQFGPVLAEQPATDGQAIAGREKVSEQVTA